MELARSESLAAAFLVLDVMTAMENLLLSEMFAFALALAKNWAVVAVGAGMFALNLSLLEESSLMEESSLIEDSSPPEDPLLPEGVFESVLEKNSSLEMELPEDAGA